MRVSSPSIVRCFSFFLFLALACLFALPVSVSAQTIRGNWTGPWENSLGQRGESPMTIYEDGDHVSGTWGNDHFEGHREGNQVSFRIMGGLNGCVNYEGSIAFYSDDAGRLTYEAHNHCTNQRYDGWQRLHRAEMNEGGHWGGDLRGVWVGHWQNSLGQSGEGRLEIHEVHNGMVRGIWDGDPFEGNRNRDEIDFRVHRGQGGCIDYDVTARFFGGDSARLEYEAHNRCNESRYSGSERLHRPEGGFRP
jgi:hypothetical protein